MDKKVLSLVLFSCLILVLFWGQAGYVAIQLSRAIHYQKVHSTKASGNKFRDTIAVSHAETAKLVWIKKDEIRYRGRMFDVKRQIALGDRILLIGHYDSKDDGYISALSLLFDGGDNNNNETGNVTMPFAFEAIMPVADLRCVHYPVIKKTITKAFLSSFYRSSEIGTAFRPPELSLIQKHTL